MMETIRIVDRNGVPWFVANDVCAVLGLKQVTRALADFPEDERMTLTISKGHSDKSGNEICEVHNSDSHSGKRDKIMTVANTDSHSGRRGGAQFINIINEAGVFRLIFKSRKPEAKRFQTWVFEEVLPSIRKYGFYKASLPKTWKYRGKDYIWSDYVAKKEKEYFKKHPDATLDEFVLSLPDR
jgi:prophage antirepressor-like protein